MENKLKAAARLLEVMDTLREKCPWDREQTFESLRNNTIEETYELVDAIAEGNMEGIKEELGDLLLHVIFYSKLGEEEGKFNGTAFDVGTASLYEQIYFKITEGKPMTVTPEMAAAVISVIETVHAQNPLPLKF